MIKKTLVIISSSIALVAAAGAVLYIRNATPVVPAMSEVEAADTTKPFVIKLHAQWCPVCMMTKGVWSDIATSYAGRVHLVVFDFTNDTTTAASRAEAHRLGLDAFYAENEGWTGTIAVLDGRSKVEKAVIHGSRDFEEYRTAIDTALLPHDEAR